MTAWKNLSCHITTLPQIKSKYTHNYNYNDQGLYQNNLMGALHCCVDKESIHFLKNIAQNFHVELSRNMKNLVK